MIKEKDIVKKLKDNWNNYFPELIGCKLEYTLKDSRVDILSSVPVNFKELGLRDHDYYCNSPVFFEVKYNSNMRDLMFELQKLITHRDFYINYGKAFCVICVISDEFDEYMVEFMETNNILMYKLSLEDEDIDTLIIEEYNSTKFELEQIQDKIVI